MLRGRRNESIQKFQRDNDYVTPSPLPAKEPPAKRRRAKRIVPNSSTAKDPYPEDE